MDHHSKCTFTFTGNEEQCQEIAAWLLRQDIQAAPKVQQVGGTSKGHDFDSWRIDFLWADILGIPSEHMACFADAGVRHVMVIHRGKIVD